MVKVVYDSRTGLGRKFAEKVAAVACADIARTDAVQPVSEPVDSPCVLVTRNVGRGKIPGSTKKFLKRYGKHVTGVVVNGDRRFGEYYCAAGPRIEEAYRVPVIRNIEGEGNDEDVREVAAFIREKSSLCASPL
ncbi:MAG: class Ib ribonucleoside-diphosphate reductase assembly flavoprotein NrdI [Coriobacteriales bacterium]|jgi:protein involved in ribonucleotide reduction|nr:class Ib ribonucleoside-diphosphate reductase assembly flavoprotein NrdI [Coriobacteriales bacterium]